MYRLILTAGQAFSPSHQSERLITLDLVLFSLNTAPQVFTRLGQTVTGYLHRQGISVVPYLDDWLIHHPDRKVLLRHQAQLINTLDLVGFALNRKKSELDLTQDIQFLGIHLRLDLGKAWEIVARARHLSSLHVLTYTQVSQLMGSLNWASGLIPLGRLYLRPLQRHFHSLGLTDRFTPPRRSDPLVLANLLRHWQDSHFLPQESPIRTVQADFTIFTDASTQGWGAHMGDSQISGIWTLTDRKLHINCLERKVVVCALQHWAPMLRRHQIMIATDNSTVVSYINKQGGTHSPTLLRLKVELLLWLDMLEAQNIIVRARHIPGCLNVIADHLSRPNQPISTEWSLHPESVKRYLQGLWDARSRHVYNSVELPPSSVHVSNSGATSPSSGCSVSRLAGEVNVHVSPIPSAQQSHSEAPIHPDGRGDFHSPLVAELVVVSTPTSSLCGTPSSLSLPSGSSVPAVCLRRKVVPSARMEALMRHFKAAGFSDEVSRLAAAPRRPSTNRMYDDRWLRFARWAAGQGFDPLDPTAAQIASFLFTLFDTRGLSPQTVKGYRTYLGSVLNRTGNAKVVLHKTISDMETVFLLAMASAGRRSELHALRFDQNYIQFKP